MKKFFLIDFDIARIYLREAETDTQLFGTRNYVPPEHHGFPQTDCRTDVYSFGILLRYMLTRRAKETPNTSLDKPMERIIRKCTAFSPKERFPNAASLKKALLAADPKSQRKHKTLLAVCAVAVMALIIFGGIKGHQHITFNPFAEGTIPAVLTDAKRVDDAISYMYAKYDTDPFHDKEAYATIGFVKKILTDVYGYDSAYVYAMPEDGLPHESKKNFSPGK